MAEKLPDQAIEAAGQLSEATIESIVAILDEAEKGDKDPVELIKATLVYHDDMFAAYEGLRHFAVMGYFEPGSFDPDEKEGEYVLKLSETGRELQRAAHQILEAKTGRSELP